MEGGVTAPPPTPNVNDNTIRRQQILDNLAKGNIGADEAAIALSKL